MIGNLLRRSGSTSTFDRVTVAGAFKTNKIIIELRKNTKSSNDWTHVIIIPDVTILIFRVFPFAVTLEACTVIEIDWISL